MRHIYARLNKADCNLQVIYTYMNAPAVPSVYFSSGHVPHIMGDTPGCLYISDELGSAAEQKLVDSCAEGCTLLLQVCVEEIKVKARELKKFQLECDLISAIFRYCMHKTHFSTCFCELLRLSSAPLSLLEMLSNVLELSATEKVCIGLAMYESKDVGIMLNGKYFLTCQIEELCRNSSPSILYEQMQEIVISLQQIGGLTRHINTFNKIVSLLKLTQSPSAVPILNKRCDFQSTNTSCEPPHSSFLADLAINQKTGRWSKHMDTLNNILSFIIDESSTIAPIPKKQFDFQSMDSSSELSVASALYDYEKETLPLSSLAHPISMASTAQATSAWSLQSTSGFVVGAEQTETPTQVIEKDLDGMVLDAPKPQVTKFTAKIRKMKRRIDMIQKNLTFSENIVLKAETKISKLTKRMHGLYEFQDNLLKENFGALMKSLKEACCQNDKDLKRLRTAFFIRSRRTNFFLNMVEELHVKHQKFSKEFFTLMGKFDDHCSRFSLEQVWIDKMIRSLDEDDTFGNAVSTIIRLQTHLSLLNQMSDSIESKDILYPRILIRLRQPFKLAKRLLNSSALIRNGVSVQYDLLRQRECLIVQKLKLAANFKLTEKEVEGKSPKLQEELAGFKEKIMDTFKEFEDNFGSILNLQEDDFNFTKFKGIDQFSWRERKYNECDITPTIKNQEGAECAFVSCTSMGESLHMRDNAENNSTADKSHFDEHPEIISFAGGNSKSDKFVLKLSHKQLKDLVNDFYCKNTSKGKSKGNTLDKCLEVMKSQGLVTEEAYNNGKWKDAKPYHIKEFKSLHPKSIEIADAFALLHQGIVLVGNFRITTQFHRLKAGDIYQIPKDATFEINPAGLIWSHCVIIVGYGFSDDGIPYFIFQNSYGPGWGDGGYGRVAIDSVKYLYAANI